MGILEQPFAWDFLRMANDGWAMGWHEANGGNLSYRLKPSEAEFVKDHTKHGSWKSLGSAYQVPKLANDCLMISATGSHFRSMDHSPKECCGIIEIDSKGSAYRTLWGFKGKGRPTCELPTHLLIHELKKDQTKGHSRVVYHTHPSDVIVLSSASASSGKKLTQKLWGAMSEAAIVLPEGVGVLPWMVPGSIELGIATCKEMTDHNAVVWAHHGLIACGSNFDKVFGLVHTIDKAAGIALKIEQIGKGSGSFISADDLRKLSNAFSLDLDLSDAATIQADKPFKPSFGTVPLSL